MSIVRTTPATDETCRQVLRTTSPGTRIRLRLSNSRSTTSLTLTAITAARRTIGAAVDGPLPVTVAGRRPVTIPAGGQATTDPVALAVLTGTDVAVSFAVAGTAELSEHPVGGATGWCTAAGAGDHTADLAGTAFTVASRAGLVLEAVETPYAVPGVLAVGDSLTDPPLPPDTYQRWPDVLAARLHRPVANVGIGGNRVVLAGGYGPTLVERFARDVLDRPGADTMVLFAGTNDVSVGIAAGDLIARLEGVCRQAREHRLRVIVVTLAPAGRRSPDKERIRVAVNAWLRTTPAPDAVVDADRLLGDPKVPTRLLASYDLGDGLHLSARGHRALGLAIAAIL